MQDFKAVSSSFPEQIWSLGMHLTCIQEAPSFDFGWGIICLDSFFFFLWFPSSFLICLLCLMSHLTLNIHSLWFIQLDLFRRVFLWPFYLDVLGSDLVSLLHIFADKHFSPVRIFFLCFSLSIMQGWNELLFQKTPSLKWGH